MLTPGFPLLSESPSDIETGPTPDTQAGVGSEMMDLLHDLQSRQDAQQNHLDSQINQGGNCIWHQS